MDDKPLKERCPRIYNICREKNVTVATVLNNGWGALTFRRTLLGVTLMMWENVKQSCEDVLLRQGEDKIKWMLTKDGVFTVKSLYRKLSVNEIGFPHKFMWKAKIPYKIKIFLWLVIKNSILTRDNLLKRGWSGNSQCLFCGQPESVEHLSFLLDGKINMEYTQMCF